MGQTLNESQRQQLRAHPDVAHVTAQHVVLRSGAVLDPSEFWAFRDRTFFVMKLLSCGCGRHAAGTHIVVQGHVERTVLGLHRQVTGGEKKVCPQGQWTAEEVLDEKQAAAHGLISRWTGRPRVPVH